MALLTIIAGPFSINPSGDYIKETIAPAPSSVIHLFNRGEYKLKSVVSLGGANTGPTPNPIKNIAF